MLPAVFACARCGNSIAGAKNLRGREPSAGVSACNARGSRGRRCLTLEGAFAVWEQYVARAEGVLKKTRNPQKAIRFETFLAEPQTPLQELAAFCGLETGDKSIRRAIATVGLDAGRANAFGADPAVRDFYDRVRNTPWMTLYGYGG